MSTNGRDTGDREPNNHKPARYSSQNQRKKVNQIKLFGRKAMEQAIIESGITADPKSLDRLLERHAQFSETIAHTTRHSILMLTASERFAGEEVPSNSAYPPEYKIKSIDEQIATIATLFPGTWSYDKKIYKSEPPKCSEGWFAIPRWTTIAPTYQEAAECALSMIGHTRVDNFKSYQDGQFSPANLQRTQRTATFMKKLESRQKNYNMLILPAQFGLRHCGRSSRRATESLFSSEFGLGVYEVAMMLLTHPERLQEFNHLWMDCTGDQFQIADPSEEAFDRTPYFYFLGGVRFDVRTHSIAFWNCGSVTAFLP